MIFHQRIGYLYAYGIVSLCLATSQLLVAAASEMDLISSSLGLGPSLGGISRNSAPVQPIGLSVQPEQSCGNRPTGLIDATLCDYETIESLNAELYENLQILIGVPFFKYLQIDLYRGCPFWEEDAICTESTCSIGPIDESEIPEDWRSKVLSKVDPVEPDTIRELGGCYYRDSDFCFLEDPKLGKYFDLSTIPERYTGYTGPSPHQIWHAIYEENCFKPQRSSSLCPATQNLEEKVYNKVISGLHASISTHICLDYLNQTTGEWSPNLQCYLTRVASHPQRLECIYFNTVLLLRALYRISPHLEGYNYHLGLSAAQVEETKRGLEKVVDMANRAGKFDESLMFQGVDAMSLREDFKYHFRNVSRIMDCIECDQCRLWGKVQTKGIATAMKILFELDGNLWSFGKDSALDRIIQREELAALINTLNRFSESLHGATRFREMWMKMHGPGHSSTNGESEDDEDKRSSTRDTESDYNTNASTSASSASLLSHYCRDSAVGCVDRVARLWTKGLKSLEVYINQRWNLRILDQSSSKTEL